MHARAGHEEDEELHQWWPAVIVVVGRRVGLRRASSTASGSGAAWPCSGGFTPKPSSPDHATSPT